MVSCLSWNANLLNEHIFFCILNHDSWGFLCITNSLPSYANNVDVLPVAPGQGDKTATMLSDGAIYSSIDFTTKSSFNCPGQIAQTTPYATTQILHSNSIHELAVDLPDPQWKSSAQQKSDLTGLGYCLPDQGKGNNGKLCLGEISYLVHVETLKLIDSSCHLH